MMPALQNRKKVKQAEILYLLSKNALTATKKQTFAIGLFLINRNGILNTSSAAEPSTELLSDEGKAQYFLAEALFLTPPEEPIGFALKLFGRLTSSRLGVVRSNREAQLPFLDSSTNTGFLFKTLQLSYLPELVFCFIDLLNKSFISKTSKTQSLYQRFEWKRFKQAFWSKESLGLVTNAVVWLAVNGSCFFLGIGWVPCVVNLAGFGFDVWHDWWFARAELKEYQELDDDETLKNLLKCCNINIDDHTLQTIRFNVQNEISVLKFKKNRLTAVAFVLFITMAMVYAPVLIPAIHSSLLLSWIGGNALIVTSRLDACKRLGSALVVFVGVFCGGLGGRIFFNGMSFLKIKKFLHDITHGQANEWFNCVALLKFTWNLIINCLVPVASIGALMLATLVFSVPTVLMLSCAVMMLYVGMTKMPTKPASPLSVQKHELPILQNIIDLESNVGIPLTSSKNTIKIESFCKHVTTTTGSTNAVWQGLCKATGLSDDELASAMADWSKPKDERKLSSKPIIKTILKQYKNVLEAKAMPADVIARSRATKPVASWQRPPAIVTFIISHLPTIFSPRNGSIIPKFSRALHRQSSDLLHHRLNQHK